MPHLFLLLLWFITLRKCYRLNVCTNNYIIKIIIYVDRNECFIESTVLFRLLIDYSGFTIPTSENSQIVASGSIYFYFCCIKKTKIETEYSSHSAVHNSISHIQGCRENLTICKSSVT